MFNRPRSISTAVVPSYTEAQLRKALAWMNRAPYTPRVDHIRAVLVRRLKTLADVPDVARFDETCR